MNHRDVDENSSRALIAADVDRVQSYVFESAKLAEMRGASLILDLVNVKDSDEDEWGDVEIGRRPIKGVPQLLKELGLNPVECIIFKGGGGLLIQAPLSQAERIRNAIEQLYVNTTLTATTTTAIEPVVSFNGERFIAKARQAKGEARRLIWHNLVTEQEWSRLEEAEQLDAAHFQRIERFGHLYNALSYRLRRLKLSKAAAPLFEVSPFTERCAYCHFRPAFQIAPEVDERPICCVCRRKRQDRGERAAHSFYLGQFWRYLDRERSNGNVLPYERGLRKDTSLFDWKDVESPPDLDFIAESSKGKTKNFVGIIYADGNNMGAKLESIAEDHQFGAFATEVRENVKESVFSALGNYLDGYRTGKCNRVKDGKACERDHKFHPFEIISIGGDDVYLFVPPDVALEIARHICEEFEKLCSRSTNTSVQGLTLSAGVLIAHVSTPVYFSRSVVKGLLKSAKQLSKTKNPPQSALDFQVITADTSISEDISAFRGQAYCNRFVGEVLTSRPVTLNQLSRLIAAVRELKSRRFPKSQLYALREAVVQGPQPRATNFYYYQKGRDDAKAESKYEPLHKFLVESADDKVLPFQSRPGESGEMEMVTPIVDLIEVYDFIRDDGSAD